jgi:ankyrin repeat protein
LNRDPRTGLASRVVDLPITSKVTERGQRVRDRREEVFRVGKTKRPSPADQLAEWRDALRRDSTIATTVCHAPESPLSEYHHRNTYLHLAADRLFDPVDSVQVAALLLEYGADPNAQNDSGWTPLHFACRIDARDEAMVGLLLCNGADPNIPDARGRTPLHYALGASEESKRIVILLLQHGANVDLDAAAQLGDVKTVRRLLRRGGLHQARSTRDLLTNAIYSDSAATVEVLLKHGVDPNQTPSFSPVPPLYTASDPLWGNVQIVRLLLEHGADPNPKRYKPLTVAKRNKPNKPEIIELLVRAGAIERGNHRTRRHT